MATTSDKNLADMVRSFVEYRRAELTHERQQIEANANGLNGASLVGFGERERFARGTLKELESFASWLENGARVFVAPLTRDELNQWRFAKEHGAEIPPHIAEQLQADGR